MDEDVAICPCCAQKRPYPTRPGRWKYKELGSDAWKFVTVKQDGEGLTMTIDGNDKPSWWPNNAEWQKA